MRTTKAEIQYVINRINRIVANREASLSALQEDVENFVRNAGQFDPATRNKGRGFSYAHESGWYSLRWHTGEGTGHSTKHGVFARTAGQFAEKLQAFCAGLEFAE